MADSNELIREQVESTAETINELEVEELRGITNLGESIPEIRPLDVKAEINMRGDIVGGITLVLGTGGPHIELDVSNAQVNGWWAGSQASKNVSKDVCDEIEDYYWRQFEELVLA